MKEYVVYPLGALLTDADFSQEKIESSLSAFRCSRETDLEDFLRKNAIVYDNIDFGKTSLIIDKNELDNGYFKVMAFYTIGKTSINIASLSKKQKRKLLGEVPGRDDLTAYPAFLIGQIGRCDSFNNIDLPGDVILNECISEIKRVKKIIGGKLIILECRPHMFDKFYQQRGFKLLHQPATEDKLYTVYMRI